MGRKRPALFRGRHFADDIIVLCVRWHVRYSLSYRDLTEIMGERNLFDRFFSDLEVVRTDLEAVPPETKTQTCVQTRLAPDS
jgi:hypothetical protein